jgi:hypothetical protein
MVNQFNADWFFFVDETPEFRIGGQLHYYLQIFECIKLTIIIGGKNSHLFRQYPPFGLVIDVGDA